MFKTEIEVKGTHISGKIRLNSESSNCYSFYPSHYHFTNQSSFTEAELNGMVEELRQIKSKISELNKPLVVTRSFIPGQRD